MSERLTHSDVFGGILTNSEINHFGGAHTGTEVAYCGEPIDKLFEIENMCYDASGNEIISLSHLRELAEAEREGCVVALPFKIGDKAYWITHFGKMKASGTVVDILIRARDVLVGINTENGSGTRKSTKDILYFQGAEAARALSEASAGEGAK